MDMKPLYLSIIFLLLIAPKAFAYNLSSTPLLVVVYGDDITLGRTLRTEQRFEYQLEKKLRSVGFNVNVTNMGKPQLAAAEAFNNIDIVIGKSPDVVILQYGDADMGSNLSADMFESNLYDTIKKLRGKNIYVMYMATRPKLYNNDEYTKNINKTINNLKTRVLNPIPVYEALEGIEGIANMTLANNYYPNEHGVIRMVEGIYPAVDAGLRWRIEVINKIREYRNDPVRLDFNTK